MPKTLRYAGIGPRTTPQPTLEVMTTLAANLCTNGWHLFSGWGTGADQAFALGAAEDCQTQWVPWTGFNKSWDSPPFKTCDFNAAVLEIAASHHPYWDNMYDSTKKLTARNVAILLGDNLQEPVSFLVYWQTAEAENAKASGTNHTRRVAKTWGIPTFNLRMFEEITGLVTLVDRLQNEYDLRIG